MSEKRYVISELDPISVLDMDTGDTFPIADGSGFVEAIVGCLNKLHEENKKLKFQNEELLYQIGEVGKNNKTCRECECFIPDIKYCYMWDMEVEADDVVVACDQRKVKNTNEVIMNDWKTI